MSLSECGGITDEELRALMTLRASRFSWFPYSKAAYPNEFRAHCRRLVLRGYAIIDNFGDDEREAAQITPAGMSATMTKPEWGEAA